MVAQGAMESIWGLFFTGMNGGFDEYNWITDLSRLFDKEIPILSDTSGNISKRIEIAALKATESCLRWVMVWLSEKEALR